MIDRTIKLTQILERVSELSNVTVGEMRSTCRERYIIDARHAFCYIARLHGNYYSYREIADEINRDHCTVLYAIRNVRGIMKVNYNYAIRIHKLINGFNGEIVGEVMDESANVSKIKVRQQTLESLNRDISILETKLESAQQLIKDQMMEIESYRKQNEILMSKQN